MLIRIQEHFCFVGATYTFNYISVVKYLVIGKKVTKNYYIL